MDTLRYKEGLELFRKNIATNYLSGYLIEKSLSVDNLFVIMAILKAFSVRKTAYKKVLFWGILGAIIMRFIFIFAGAALINRFEWLLYFFGAYLLYVGVKMYKDRNKEIRIEPQDHPIVKFLRNDSKFSQGMWTTGSLSGKIPGFYHSFVYCYLLVEASDLIFALDSIPAVFASPATHI